MRALTFKVGQDGWALYDSNDRRISGLSSVITMLNRILEAFERQRHLPVLGRFEVDDSLVFFAMGKNERELVRVWEGDIEYDNRSPFLVVEEELADFNVDFGHQYLQDAKARYQACRDYLSLEPEEGIFEPHEFTTGLSLKEATAFSFITPKLIPSNMRTYDQGLSNNQNTIEEALQETQQKISEKIDQLDSKIDTLNSSIEMIRLESLAKKDHTSSSSKLSDLSLFRTEISEICTAVGSIAGNLAEQLNIVVEKLDRISQETRQEGDLK